MRGSWASNQAYIVLVLASWGRRVNGRDAVLPLGTKILSALQPLQLCHFGHCLPPNALGLLCTLGDAAHFLVNVESFSLQLWVAGLQGSFSLAFVILADGPRQEVLEEPPGLAACG